MTPGRRAAGREFLGRWGFALVGLVTSLVVTARTHWLFVRPYSVPVSNDEGYISAMALRMVRGHWLPYVDGVSQRGPILYWVSTLALRVGGMWSWMTVRGLGFILAVCETTLVFALATLLFSPMAGGVAAMVLTYFLTYELNPWDGIGVNGEPVAVVFALGAGVLVAYAQLRAPRRRRGWVFWAGVLSACAGLSKQMFLVHAAPVALWLALGPAGAAAVPRRARARELLLFSSGVAVPFALVVGLYAATGHLAAFWYYYQRYGREIFMAPITPEVIRDKVHDQIDHYYLGIAALALVWFYTVARALQQTLAWTDPGTAAPAEPVRVSDAARLPLAPEAHAALNLVAPGLGLGLVPRRRGAGLVALLGGLALVVTQAAVRGESPLPRGYVSLGADLAAWWLAGLLACGATVVLVARDHRAARWGAVARVRAHAGAWFAAAQMACALAGACFTFRFFPHYFVEFFPFAAVVVGAAATASFAGLDARDRPGQLAALVLVAGGVLVLAVAHAALRRNVALRRVSDPWYQHPGASPIVRYIVEHTRPDQTIFVWGFRAEIYLTARRYPASRFVYTVYPAGVVPWFQASPEDEEARAVPGARRELIADLERDQAEIIVDAGRSMNGRYMYNYPELRREIDQRYCFVKYIEGEPIYRRRHGTCSPMEN